MISQRLPSVAALVLDQLADDRVTVGCVGELKEAHARVCDQTNVDSTQRRGTTTSNGSRGVWRVAARLAVSRCFLFWASLSEERGSGTVICRGPGPHPFVLWTQRWGGAPGLPHRTRVPFGTGGLPGFDVGEVAPPTPRHRGQLRMRCPFGPAGTTPRSMPSFRSTPKQSNSTRTHSGPRVLGSRSHCPGERQVEGHECGGPRWGPTHHRSGCVQIATAPRSSIVCGRYTSQCNFCGRSPSTMCGTLKRCHPCASQEGQGSEVRRTRGQQPVLSGGCGDGDWRPLGQGGHWVCPHDGVRPRKGGPPSPPPFSPSGLASTVDTNVGSVVRSIFRQLVGDSSLECVERHRRSRVRLGGFVPQCLIPQLWRSFSFDVEGWLIRLSRCHLSEKIECPVATVCRNTLFVSLSMSLSHTIAPRLLCRVTFDVCQHIADVDAVTLVHDCPHPVLPRRSASWHTRRITSHHWVKNIVVHLPPRKDCAVNPNVVPVSSKNFGVKDSSPAFRRRSHASLLLMSLSATFLKHHLRCLRTWDRNGQWRNARAKHAQTRSWSAPATVHGVHDQRLQPGVLNPLSDAPDGTFCPLVLVYRDNFLVVLSEGRRPPGAGEGTSERAKTVCNVTACNPSHMQAKFENDRGGAVRRADGGLQCGALQQKLDPSLLLLSAPLQGAPLVTPPPIGGLSARWWSFGVHFVVSWHLYFLLFGSLICNRSGNHVGQIISWSTVKSHLTSFDVLQGPVEQHTILQKTGNEDPGGVRPDSHLLEWSTAPNGGWIGVRTRIDARASARDDAFFSAAGSHVSVSDSSRPDFRGYGPGTTAQPGLVCLYASAHSRSHQPTNCKVSFFSLLFELLSRFFFCSLFLVSLLSLSCLFIFSSFSPSFPFWEAKSDKPPMEKPTVGLQ